MDSDGAVHIPAVPTHRLELAPAAWRARVPNRFDGNARAWLWELRWRRPGQDRVLVVTAAALVVLAHVAAFVLLSLSTATPVRLGSVAVDESEVMQVRLIESPPPPPPPPAPPQPPTVQVLPAVHVTRRSRPPRKPAVPSPPRPTGKAFAAQPTAPPVRLYNSQGRLLLPQLPAPTRSVAEYQVHLPQGTPSLMHPPPPPVSYKPTKLEKYFVPPNENIISKAVRKTTVAHTFNLPLNIHITCVLAPLALMSGACGFTAPQELSPRLRVKHNRDNLAPATPLLRQPAPARARAASSPKPPAATRSVAAPAAAHSVTAPASAASS